MFFFRFVKLIYFFCFGLRLYVPVNNFSVMSGRKIYFFIVVAICYLVHEMDTVHDLCKLLTSTGNLHLNTCSPKGNDLSPEIKQVFLNSSQVSIRFFSIGQWQPTLQSMVGPNLTSIKGCNSVANLQKNDALQSQRRSCQR